MSQHNYGRFPVEIAEYNLTVWGERRQAESLAEKFRGGIQQSSDICQVSPSVCRGNLGVPRSKMPQLEGSIVTNFLRAYQNAGIRVSRGAISVGRLKATQKEIQAAKALRMAREYVEGRFPDIADSVIVSKDNYILDGQIRNLLRDAQSFGGVGFAGFDAPSAGR